MLVFETEMHIVTFVLVCFEVLVLLCLVLYKLIKPGDRNTFLNILLVLILITYNVTGGLLPDASLPGTEFIQNCIAYGTGFLGPTYFPYYVYQGFGLKQMKFHRVKGVTIFLIIPYVFFVGIYAWSGSLERAQITLIIPFLYAIWVITSLVKSISIKYADNVNSNTLTETIILVLSLSPWVFLPIIDFFNAGQAIEVITMNSGFLLLLTFQINQDIHKIRRYHLETFRNSTPAVIREAIVQADLPADNLTPHTYNLTKREREIVALILKGLSYKKISEELFISERTVKKHAEHIFEKTKVTSKFELLTKLQNSQQAQWEK